MFILLHKASLAYLQQGGALIAAALQCVADCNIYHALGLLPNSVALMNHAVALPYHALALLPHSLALLHHATSPEHARHLTY